MPLSDKGTAESAFYIGEVFCEVGFMITAPPSRLPHQLSAATSTASSLAYGRISKSGALIT